MPRSLVHKMLQNEDPEGLEFRQPSSKEGEKKGFFGLSHWVCMDVLTFIQERSYFCPSATRSQIL